MFPVRPSKASIMLFCVEGASIGKENFVSDQLLPVVAPVVERITALAKADSEFREQLRNLGEAIVAVFTEVPEPVQVFPSSLVPQEQPVLEKEPVSASGSFTEASEALPTTVPLHVPERQWFPRSVSRPIPTTDEDLPLIEERCRLKAEAARWCASRRKLLAAGADYHTEIRPVDQDLFRKAKEIGCYLWMCDPNRPQHSDSNPFDILGDCYEALAEGLALLLLILHERGTHHDSFEDAVQFVAEAQSALVVAIQRMNGPADEDQGKVFYWLRGIADQEEFVIRRFMRLDDPASPSGVPGLLHRIAAIRTRVGDARDRGRRHRKCLGSLQHCVEQIRSVTCRDAEEQWQSVNRFLDDLVNDGMPPSHVQVRELLLPVIDDMPEGIQVSRGFALVLRECDRFLASRPHPFEKDAIGPASDVVAVRKLLKGRSLVLIGGYRRLAAEKAIKQSFALSEVIWLEAGPTASVFESSIAKPEVAAALLAIRWSPHAYGDVAKICERLGKPLVRLPGGYNPNQVAAQILSQCSDRLAKDQSK